MANVPAQLKPAAPYLTRAAEIESVDPVVAYFCRTHALEVCMSLPAFRSDPESKRFAIGLMESLEASKATMGPVPEGRAHVEGFCLNLFKNVDDVDRRGEATLDTARGYLAASHLIDVLAQFGPIDPQLKTMQTYAKFKATDIPRAIKAGQRPRPGPPTAGGATGADEPPPPPEQPPAPLSQTRSSFRAPDAPGPDGPPSSASSRPMSAASSHGPPPASYGAPPIAAASSFSGPASGVSGPAPPSRMGPPSGPSSSSGTPAAVSVAVIAQAQQLCKYSISALNFNDVPEAVKNLRQALALLTGERA